jgi:hypothetical protein
MKAVGRFIFRGCDDKDGLIIGASFRSHNFKPNTVYEIRDVVGELMVCEVGESIIAGRDETYQEAPSRDTWGSAIGDILANHGAELMLSRAEYAVLKYRQHRQQLIKHFSVEQVVQWELEGKDLNEVVF